MVLKKLSPGRKKGSRISFERRGGVLGSQFGQRIHKGRLGHRPPEKESFS